MYKGKTTTAVKTKAMAPYPDHIVYMNISICIPGFLIGCWHTLIGLRFLSTSENCRKDDGEALLLVNKSDSIEKVIQT